MWQRCTGFLGVLVLLAVVPSGAVAADMGAWQNAAIKASPTFFAMDVEDGVYDIGSLGGEITYEFVVQSNPEEEQASMCLIGRRDFGDTQAGLKYEQWNNTGTYGATIFGVADYDFGVANDPGVVTHLVFVSSEEMGTTDLYVNGAYQGSVASAITLSGLVGIGYGAQDREGADPFFDDFDGAIFGVAIYDRDLSATEIRRNAGAYFETPLVAWVSYHAADDEPHADAAAVGFTQAPDIGYTDLLKANGYDVVRVLTSQEPDVENLNAFDLVIISRTASSGHYSGSGATLWNSITAPMINLNGYTLRNSRLGFTDGGTMVDTTGDITLAVTDPNHPIFAGVELVDGMMVNPFAEGAVPLPTDPSILSRGISVNTDNLDEEGTVLATVATADDPTLGGIIIAELPAGATLQNSSGSPDDVLGGFRLVFLTGSREPDGVTGGQAAALYDLYPDGEQMFLNAVAYMLGKGVPYIYTFAGDAAGAGELGDNDSLDGMWDHDNGSDAWDGSMIGEAAPGGVSALVEEDVTFVRIQDTGDPRDYGFSDPSNRKIYLTRAVASDLDGTQIEFRIRVATSAPLDDVNPDGGAGTEPWPTEGIAYHVRDGGKGMIGVGQAGLGVISFSLARGGQPGLEDVVGDVLVMNNLVGDAPSGDVDTEDTADTIVGKNWIAVDDVTQWNTFTVGIAAGGAGTHIVAISVNGGPAQLFDVTAGDGLEGEGSYLAMGSSGTGAVAAFDVDYVAFKPGVIPEPEPEPEPEPVVVSRQ